jgi:hypothetical protein
VIERFGRKVVVDFFQYWTHCQDNSGNTLTAAGEAALLQKLKVSKNNQKQSSLDKPQ